MVKIMGISKLFLLAYLYTTSKVGIPSTTPVLLLTISFNDSPLPNLKPRVLFLDKLPKLVSIKSPIPAKPKNVSSFAPYVSINKNIFK